MKFQFTTGWLKFVLGWVAVFLFRLIPFRPPNVEPMLATIMPFSKRFGIVGSFLFGFLGIILFDAVTSGWGIWTLVTALAYGTLGVGARLFFLNHEASVGNFLGFGIAGTLFYDVATGLTIGPLFQGQSFMAALVGQIPFTAMHLSGTIIFAIFLSPVVYRWIVQNEILELSILWKRTLSAIGVR